MLTFAEGLWVSTGKDWGRIALKGTRAHHTHAQQHKNTKGHIKNSVDATICLFLLLLILLMLLLPPLAAVAVHVAAVCCCCCSR